MEQTKELKTQPDTPQGRRDVLLMALLLDLGLRVGEVVLLEVADFNLKENILHFDRPKVGIDQTHTLPADLKTAVAAWLSSGDCAPFGPVLRESGKGGRLTESGMSERAITTRVLTLEKAIGVFGLSAHDCRHYWATQAAKRGTDARGEPCEYPSPTDKDDYRPTTGTYRCCG